MIVEGGKKGSFAGRKTFFLVSVLKRFFLLIQFDFTAKPKPVRYHKASVSNYYTLNFRVKRLLF